MKLDLTNILGKEENNNFIQNFLAELQKYIEKNMKKEETSLGEDDYKLITKFRDKFYLERSNILNFYANKTKDKGPMYYIYNKSTTLDNTYNLCICDEEKINNVIEIDKSKLPNDAKIGSILRKEDDNFYIDNELTNQIEIEILNLKNKIIEEQIEFLKNSRIEGHVYELSEKSEDRVWLFDITNNSFEALEEIDFPIELLTDFKEGDLFIFEDGEYKKYIK